MAYDLLVLNGTLVTPEDRREQDIAVAGEQIAAVCLRLPGTGSPIPSYTRPWLSATPRSAWMMPAGGPRCSARPRGGRYRYGGIRWRAQRRCTGWTHRPPGCSRT